MKGLTMDECECKAGVTLLHCQHGADSVCCKACGAVWMEPCERFEEDDQSH